MIGLRDISIKSKLRATTMLTVGAALFLASVTFLGYDLFVLRSGMENNLSVLAEIIGGNSTAALSFDDAESGQQILEGLKADVHITAAVIYLPDGQVFASYARPDKRAGFRPLRLQSDGLTFTSNAVQLFHTVKLDGRRIGALYLESDLEEMRTRTKRFAIITLAILSVSLLLALVLASRLQRVVSVPILRLSETARAVSAEKNYGVRAIKHSQDELGHLTDVFNEMLAQIQQRDQSLEQQREHLEEEVGVRTRELSETNQELRSEVIERKRAEVEMVKSNRLALLAAETGVALARAKTLGQGLQQCAEAVVRNVDAAFARIWTLNESEGMLEL